MSSTNRTRRERNTTYDYYVTPQDHIELFLNEFARVDSNFPAYLRNSNVLDPGAGGQIELVGEAPETITEMSYPAVIKKMYGVDIDTFDLRPDSPAKIHGDFLVHNFNKQYDVIITNPPFNIIEDFINRALSIVSNGGYVIMLCRLNFFGSKKRFNFFQKTPPNYCFVHHKRMSFTKDGKTDSIEYCHNVWIKGNKCKFTKLMVI